ncbi:MAG: hypothetical protein ACOH1H_06895, partial [Brevundimonas sp.]
QINQGLSLWLDEKRGSRHADLTDMSFDEIVAKFYTVTDIEDFGVSFASPGRLGFKTRNEKLAVFVTSMVGILGAGVISAASAGHMPDVKICTPGGAVPVEVQETEQQLNYAMKSIGEDVVVEATKKSDQSKADVDLQADVTVK